MPYGAARRAREMKRDRHGAFLPRPEGAKPRRKRSERNQGEPWTAADTKELRRLIGENTPTRVIGLKLGRTVGSVRYHVRKEGLSLKPTNQSPYTRRSGKTPRGRAANLH